LLIQKDNNFTVNNIYIMKKICLAITALTMYHVSNAQLSKGGIPQSFNLNTNTDVAALNYKAPSKEDYDKVLQESFEKNPFGSFKVGINMPINVKFPESGTFEYAANGDVVWRAQVKIDGAPAVTFVYDHFVLPKGVKMYLYNGNKKQILGAYTQENNSPVDEKFSTEAVQGDVVNIELNIASNVNSNDIKLNINSALVYFTSYEYLNQYITMDDAAKPTDPDQFGLEGRSSQCMINALCPQGDGYEEYRKATVQILDPSSGGACSATMVNTTNNNEADCKQYLATASHCESTGNSVSDDAFSTLLIRYNFQKTACSSTTAAQVNTLTGANFKARSPFSSSMQPGSTPSDFMLLEVRSPIPESWNVNLAGWDRSATVTESLTDNKKYIGFHHPGADIKKILFNKNISNSTFGISYPNNYFSIALPSDQSGGGAAPGSSGSGLSNGDGKIIGIASTANNPLADCGPTNLTPNNAQKTFFLSVKYGKFSSTWENDADPSKQLKAWLDPTNTGAITTNTLTSSCKPVAGGVSINNIDADFNNSINIYPNPSTNGHVTVQLNMKEAAKVVIDIYNVAGAKVGTIDLGTITNTKQVIDLSQYANGMYILKFNNGNTTVNKKVMLVK
jgi:hypothetical protein